MFFSQLLHKKLIILLIINILSIKIYSQNIVADFTDSPIIQNANVSLLVSDVCTGNAVCEYRSCNKAIPASTMKVVTTATALELLGKDFRFRTSVEIDAKPDADSVLQGNIYIRGGGDPTLGSAFFDNDNFMNDWILAIKNAGIKTVKGKIITIENNYEYAAVNAKWLWEDLGNYYASGVYGISYKDNTYQLTLKSGKAGAQPVIIGILPKIDNLEFENHLIASNSGDAYIQGMPRSKYRVMYGSIPVNRSAYTIKGDIPNPAELLTKEFSAQLKKAGIAVSNREIANTPYNALHITLYTRLSPPLIDIVSITNRISNNHFAEHIFRYLAFTRDSVSTWKGAAAAVKNFWQTEELPVNQLTMYDGSGLSPMDNVSANFLVELLNYMQNKSPNAALFKASLPAAGFEGTVASVLKNTELAGKVRMKSGTISQVRCYAGYMDVSPAKTLSFAVMVNYADASASAVTVEIEKFLLNVYYKVLAEEAAQ